MPTKTSKKAEAAEAAEAKKQEALTELRNVLTPGTTVYTCNARVQGNNMGADIKVLIVNEGKIINISGRVSDALGLKWKDSGSVYVSGFGLDRGYHLTMNISYALHGHDAETIAPNRPGYTLQHEWI